MIGSFLFARLPKIIFGAGKISSLPGIARATGKSVILVTGNKSFTGSSYSEELLESFKRMGIGIHLLTVSGEPTVQMIDSAVDRFRQIPVDGVVAIGGGSALDTGKAISAMLYRPESVEDFLEGVGNREHPGTKVPFIAVPTTAGTGSEATKNAVISRVGENGYKRSLRHDNFVPDVALVDPGVFLGPPQEIAVACGMDCFVQLTEAYLSTGANPYTDALAVEGLKAVKSSLIPFLTNRNNADAASGMSYAALTSGICLANAGLGVIHGFASSIGGLFEIPHGMICGKLMAAANEINVRKLRQTGTNPGALVKYAALGRLFFEKSGKSDNFYIDGFIDFLKSLRQDFQMPGFRTFGIKGSQLEEIVRETAVKSNPVSLSPDELIEIVTSGL